VHGQIGGIEAVERLRADQFCEQAGLIAAGVVQGRVALLAVLQIPVGLAVPGKE